MVTSNAKRLDWLLDDLIGRLVGAEKALVLSADGLVISRSQSLVREDAERLAAMASAFQSLARGVGEQFDKGNVRQTVVELDDGFLIVLAAGGGACLSMLATENADMAMIAYELNVLVQQVGHSLATEPRRDIGDLQLDLKR